jgi:DNA-directed RNA polymerase I, II, and III subunit RPABC2
MSYNDYNGDGDDFDEDYEYFDVEELTDDEQQLNDVEILNELEDKYETEEIDDYGSEGDKGEIRIRKIKDNYRQTNNILTKYEKARVLGIRSLQLSLNFKPMIKTDISDTYKIAKIELKNKIIPLKIKRYINKYEYEEWNVNDLIDLDID